MLFKFTCRLLVEFCSWFHWPTVLEMVNSGHLCYWLALTHLPLPSDPSWIESAILDKNSMFNWSCTVAYLDWPTSIAQIGLVIRTVMKTFPENIHTPFWGNLSFKWFSSWKTWSCFLLWFILPPSLKVLLSMVKLFWCIWP